MFMDQWGDDEEEEEVSQQGNPFGQQSTTTGKTFRDGPNKNTAGNPFSSTTTTNNTQNRNSGSRGGANPFSNSYAPIALGQVSHPEVIGQYGQQRPISLSPLSQCNKKC